MQADQKSLPSISPSARPSPQIFQKACDANALGVRELLSAAIARFAQQISKEEAGTLELVLAEVMNNIVEHSYRGREPGIIDLSIVRDSRGLSCSVCDDGIMLPADHLLRNIGRLPRPDPLEFPEGGFGWFLIRDLAQDLGYHREGSRNLLAFRLPIGAMA